MFIFFSYDLPETTQPSSSSLNCPVAISSHGIVWLFVGLLFALFSYLVSKYLFVVKVIETLQGRAFGQNCIPFDLHEIGVLIF